MKNALAVYKNRPALIKETAGDKIQIALTDGQILKVRVKDFEIIHPGPVSDLAGLEHPGGQDDDQTARAVRDAWELLESAGGTVPLGELAELAFGGSDPRAAWDAYRLLLDGLYFSGTAAAVKARTRAEVESGEKKRQEKQKESGDREQFLEYLRRRVKAPAELPAELPDGSRFMQDVEALALGKTARSKTMKDLGQSETPEDAHALLLHTGFWTHAVNPHPARFGCSLIRAQSPLAPPPGEERRDLTHLPAFAIDNPWSGDPDDAVSVEESGGRTILYVHIADPASSISPDSAGEREARDRGATLYLPEGSFRMLADEALPLFALGLRETSPALTFRITLGESGEIENTGIFPSIVAVRRLNYREADMLISDSSGDAAVLRTLNALAEKNIRRRTAAGAVNIELPEVHLTAGAGQAAIEPVPPSRSADIVRECMLLAGEGAARWALERRIESSGASPAFPFVCQEAGELPAEILPGLAGSYQLRRCMRPRSLSLKPGPHWGLGLDVYTQVTSPLRRYTDLLAHIQIRALLRGENPLPAEETAARLAAGEAAAAAAAQAERASRTHWTMVYLSDKKDSAWDAVALEKKGHRWALSIPALAHETQVPLRNDIAPNDTVRLALKSVNIPRGEAVFVETAG